MVAYVAGRELAIAPDELNAAVRRALLVFAAGGDLRREPTAEDSAVRSLADDLDAPGRRQALLDAIGAFADEPAAPGAVARLVADPNRAWRAYACGLLADAVGEE